jgi:hypothetical protein
VLLNTNETKKAPLPLLSLDRSGILCLFSLKRQRYSGEQERCWQICLLLVLLKSKSLDFVVFSSRGCIIAVSLMKILGFASFFSGNFDSLFWV